MGTHTFDPEAIREMARRVSSPLMAGATAARGHASGRQIKLPKKTAEVEAKLNQILARLPEAMSILEQMTEGFDRRLRATADAYEATESSNTGASGGMSS